MLEGSSDYAIAGNVGVEVPARAVPRPCADVRGGFHEIGVLEGACDVRDRQARRRRRATALSGLAVIFTIIVAFLVELARGHNGNPYTWLGAIGGLTYIAAIVIFRLRG